MFKEISFPKDEYKPIQNYLDKQGYCYTTRVYKESCKYFKDIGLPYELTKFS